MAIPLRSDFDAAALRGLARRTKDGPQARRLLALASNYDGASRAEAAQIGSVTRQIVRDWVVHRIAGLGSRVLIIETWYQRLVSNYRLSLRARRRSRMRLMAT